MDRHEGLEIFKDWVFAVKGERNPIEAIRKALEFYEEVSHYDESTPVHPVNHDQGAIAQMALEALEKFEEDLYG